MAGDFERISTDEVLGVADRISKLNIRLGEEVSVCQELINQLRNGWTGEAAEATVSIFSAFAKSYVENDHQLIESYAQFLKQAVAPNWESTESANTELGESFK